MRVALIPVVLVLAAACIPAASRGLSSLPDAAAATDAPSRFAALDDVRLLASGLLQLGQSLREFVQKTKGQINDILQKLNIFDHSFYRLSVLASEIKEEEEELKKTTVVLKANNEEIKGLSEEINSKMDSILQEKNQLQSKVQGLEEKLSSLSNGLVTSEQLAEINKLRDVIHSQEQNILELLKAVTEQSDQLNYQRSKIKALEEKLTANMLAQETVERMTDNFNSEAPTLTPYLTPTSSSTGTVTSFPSDCSELFGRGELVSGLYAVRPSGSRPFMVFCDMSNDHGATVIQRRTDGSVNFDQTWEKYEQGFGDFQGEFWLGLSKIRSLVSQGNSVLHILLEDWKHNRRFIEYSFHLDGPEDNYRVHLTYLSGNLPDPLTNHSGLMFSTKDKDNDKHQGVHCAQQQTGGWWFDACGDTNLNGRYFHTRPKWRSDRRKGIQCGSGRKSSYSIRLSQISIYPASSSRTGSPASASSEAGNFS
ncbi:angiopoietin-related protein 3-like [Salarias fasciatus]|uniref:Angiopoietin-related protein 3-like n=1 Tax=Salarias fasciatus TaxID=181472 RepID=A0A672I812_SALFA|nr:angiopoietin-related protein 3-like [Salarias fasciatus]